MNIRYENINNNDSELCVNCIISENIDDLITTLHIHDELEIVYVINGSLSLTVDSNEYALTGNDIAVINRLAPHRFNTDVPIKYLLLQFKPTTIYESNKSIDIKYLKPFFHTKEFFCYTGSCKNQIMKEIISVIFEIESQIKEKSLAYEIAVQSDLIRLLYLMHRAETFGGKIFQSIKQKRDLQSLATLLEYLELHYSEVITLEQACSIAKLDYHYFSRVFKEKTGKSFVEYLTFIRILNAQKLLCETEDNITEIAESVGIPNTSYFNRMFKKQNGITPIQYRKCRGMLSK